MHKLSRYWWIHFWFFLLLGIVVEIVLLVLTIILYIAPSPDKLFLPFLYASLGWVILSKWSILDLAPRWFYTKYNIKNNKIISMYFKRELCRIDLEKVVYYAIFVTKESGWTYKTCIAISNEPFVFPTGWAEPWLGVVFLSTYWKKHRQTIIILPDTVTIRKLIATEYNIRIK